MYVYSYIGLVDALDPPFVIVLQLEKPLGRIERCVSKNGTVLLQVPFRLRLNHFMLIATSK